MTQGGLDRNRCLLSWLLKNEKFSGQRREELYFRQTEQHVQKHRAVKGPASYDNNGPSQGREGGSGKIEENAGDIGKTELITWGDDEAGVEGDSWISSLGDWHHSLAPIKGRIDPRWEQEQKEQM